MGKMMYKVSQSTGKVQVWEAYAEGDQVVRVFGEMDGAMQEPRYTAKSKNTGRSNATTAEGQALVEVEALYTERYTNKHYRYSVEEAVWLSEQCKEPRKIHKYNDHGHKLPDPVYVSVKEDGSRACILGGAMFSKIGRGEDIKVEHLRNAVAALGDVDFDSEVYAHDLSLQRIRSAWLKPIRTDKEIIKVANDKCKKKGTEKVKTLSQALEVLGYNPNEDAPKLKLNIFDIPVTGVPFKERIELMLYLHGEINRLGLQDNFNFLFPKLMTKAEAEKLHDEVVLNGHEGLVFYDPEDLYEFGKRSYTCQKDKRRHDSEAFVTGVEPCKNGTGKLLLRACDELDNVTFKCMIKVTRRDGIDYPRDYETMKELIGQWITFSYENLSDAGIPAKPVGECTRLCNDKGEPLE